jgi:hypothetical protein
MLLLTTTSDVIRIVTDAAVTVDVHASWVDRNGSTDTPGSTNTAISTATTTTVVASPASSTYRNVRRMVIRNKHASSSVGVTVQLYNGATAYELDKRTLAPGSSLTWDDLHGFYPTSSVTQSRPWHGVVAGCAGEGNPGDLMLHVQRAGNVAATPTNISTSVARCSAFMLPADMTVNRIRAFGVGATTNVYRVALYRYSDLARLTNELAFTTAVDTWVSIGSALGVSLTKDTLYFIACSVNATGTTAGLTCMGGTTAATTGRVNTAPGSLPGSLAMSGYKMDHFQFQFAVTTGALPNPAAALAAPAAWTGGMPAFWIDSVDS